MTRQILRALRAAACLLLLVVAPSARAEVALPLEEEEFAKASIKSLRDAGRGLKRLSRESRKGEPDYSKWLERSSKEIQALLGRWASVLDYFGRDFPHDALRADPERYAYAKDWLAERNAEFDEQARDLRQQLLEDNACFEGKADAARVAAAREVLEGIG